MNFDSVFRLLLKSFQKNNVNFALIGGFAMQAAGHQRTTQDIDFLVADEDMLKVKKFLLSIGYEVLHESKDVSNFVGKMRELGRVDFLRARRKYTKKMLERAAEHAILNNTFKVKIIGPEDLIGLKIQSSTNDQDRYHQDMADVETLLRLHQGKLDLELVKEYFTLFAKEQEFRKIMERLNGA